MLFGNEIKGKVWILHVEHFKRHGFYFYLKTKYSKAHVKFYV